VYSRLSPERNSHGTGTTVGPYSPDGGKAGKISIETITAEANFVKR